MNPYKAMAKVKLKIQELFKSHTPFLLFIIALGCINYYFLYTVPKDCALVWEDGLYIPTEWAYLKNSYMLEHAFPKRFDLFSAPFAAYPITSSYYFPTVIFSFLCNNSFVALRYAILFHIILSGISLYILLVDVLKLNKYVGLFGASFFITGVGTYGYTSCILNSLIPYIFASPWIILGIVFLLKIFYEKKIFYSCLLGMTIAFNILNGSSYVLVHGIVFLSVILTFFICINIKAYLFELKMGILKEVSFLCKLCLLSVFCAVMLSSVKLIPLLEYSPFTFRNQELPFMEATGGLVSQPDFNAFVIWGKDILGPLYLLFVAGIILGIIPAILLRDKKYFLWLYALLISVWLALGANAPFNLYGIVYYIFPPIRTMQTPSRLCPFVRLSLIVLVCISFNYLLTICKIKNLKLRKIVYCSLTVLLFCWVFFYTHKNIYLLNGQCRSFNLFASYRTDKAMDNLLEFAKSERYPAFRISSEHDGALKLSDSIIRKFQINAYNINKYFRCFLTYIAGKGEIARMYPDSREPPEMYSFLRNRYKLLGMISTKYIQIPYHRLNSILSSSIIDSFYLEPIVVDKDTILFENKAFLPRVFLVDKAVLLIGEDDNDNLLAPQSIMLIDYINLDLTNCAVFYKIGNNVVDKYPISLLSVFKDIYLYNFILRDDSRLILYQQKNGIVLKRHPLFAIDSEKGHREEQIRYININIDELASNNKGHRVEFNTAVRVPRDGLYSVRIYPKQFQENVKDRIELNLGEQKIIFQGDLLTLPLQQKTVSLNKGILAVSLSKNANNAINYILSLSPVLHTTKINYGNYKIINYYSNEINISFETAKENSFLIVNELYLPMYRAYMDNKPIDIYMANGSIMGFIISSPGKHILKLVYNPLSHKIGFFLSMVSFVVLIGYFFYLRKNKYFS